MKHTISVLWVFSLFVTTSSAQEVGIDFESMKTGTRLTTTTVWQPETTYIEEYIGEEGDYFVMQTYKLMEDGSVEPRNKVGYDKRGRKVFSTLNEKTNTYTPYSCEYVVGKCSHTYRYFNSFTDKYVTNEGNYRNRLDGDTLYVGVITFDDSMYEVPFKLGPHRLRVSNEYNNALGKPTGYQFVDLEIP